MEKNLQTFNADHVVSVKLTPKQLSPFTWVNEERKWWGIKYKAGFYNYFPLSFSSIHTEEELVNGKTLANIKYLVEDKKVYFKPYITVSFVDGDKIVKQFDTYKETKKVYQIISDQIIRKLKDSEHSKI